MFRNRPWGNAIQFLGSEGITCDASWSEAVSDAKRDVVSAADLENVVPVLVCKVLLVLQKTQLQAPEQD